MCLENSGFGADLAAGVLPGYTSICNYCALCLISGLLEFIPALGLPAASPPPFPDRQFSQEPGVRSHSRRDIPTWCSSAMWACWRAWCLRATAHWGDGSSFPRKLPSALMVGASTDVVPFAQPCCHLQCLQTRPHSHTILTWNNTDMEQY